MSEADDTARAEVEAEAEAEGGSGRARRVLGEEELTAYERWELPHVGGGDGSSPRPRGRGAVTAAELEDLQRQAYEEGFAKGYADGVARGESEGRATAEAQAGPALDALQQGLTALGRPLEQLDEEIVQTLASLAIAVAEQLLLDALELDPGRVLGIVRGALEALPSTAREVVLELHPDDAALVREGLSGMPPDRPWTLRENPALGRGGCRIESSTSHVDATLEARLEQVRAHVLGRGGAGLGAGGR